MKESKEREGRKTNRAQRLILLFVKHAPEGIFCRKALRIDNHNCPFDQTFGIGELLQSDDIPREIILGGVRRDGRNERMKEKGTKIEKEKNQTFLFSSDT